MDGHDIRRLPPVSSFARIRLFHRLLAAQARGSLVTPRRPLFFLQHVQEFSPLLRENFTDFVEGPLPMLACFDLPLVNAPGSFLSPFQKFSFMTRSSFIAARQSRPPPQTYFPCFRIGQWRGISSLIIRGMVPHLFPARTVSLPFLMMFHITLEDAKLL